MAAWNLPRFVKLAGNLEKKEERNKWRQRKKMERGIADRWLIFRNDMTFEPTLSARQMASQSDAIVSHCVIHWATSSSPPSLRPLPCPSPRSLSSLWEISKHLLHSLAFWNSCWSSTANIGADADECATAHWELAGVICFIWIERKRRKSQPRDQEQKEKHYEPHRCIWLTLFISFVFIFFLKQYWTYLCLVGFLWWWNNLVVLFYLICLYRNILCFPEKKNWFEVLRVEALTARRLSSRALGRLQIRIAGKHLERIHVRKIEP